MQFEKQVIYLPIRSFGDFIISAAVLKRYATIKVPIYLSKYLKDIYEAIDGDDIFDIVANLDFNNQPAYFELHKVRDGKNIKRLLSDIKKSFLLDSSNTYLLDFRSRRLFFLNRKLVWPDDNENIYDAKYALFSRYFSLNDNNFDCKLSLCTKPQKVVIFPESRVKEKEINQHLLMEIVSTFKNIDISIARFLVNAADKNPDPDTIYYSNFKELINIIEKKDLIISAESLPYHLASFCNKPHFVIYKNTKHFKATFMTAFMKANNYYSVFDGVNTNAVLYKLSSILN
ncbi:MAG: hypothetical protein ACRYFA_08150 [Janthinobacterium lividum]